MSDLLPAVARRLGMVKLTLACVVIAALVTWLLDGASLASANANTVAGVAAITAIMWLVVTIMDLVLFPDTNMVPFVKTQSAPVAAVIVTVSTAFAGLLLNYTWHGLVASWVTGWIQCTALVTAVLFVTERRRQNKIARSSALIGSTSS